VKQKGPLGPFSFPHLNAHGHEIKQEFVRIFERSLKIAPQSIAIASEPFNGNVDQHGDEQKWHSKISTSPNACLPSGARLFQFVAHHGLSASLFKEFLKHDFV